MINQQKYDRSKRTFSDTISIDDEEQATFEQYNGSYAQDVEGYSDQEINDAFGGEPDAYWNID